jgi:thiamine kinase-like enzyme
MCAGVGSRVQIYSNLHKALLPIGNRAVISRILDSFPKEVEIVIALGYMADQVRSFLEYAHYDRKFTFVYVDNYDKVGSGPGYSLLQCKNFLQCPFVFTSADTIVDKEENNLIPDKNWIGIGYIPENKSGGSFLLYDERKGLYYGKGTNVFVGMAGIFDFEKFWNGLENSKLQLGEYQVVNGLSVINNFVVKRFNSWQDTGSVDNYNNTLSKYGKIVENKKNEVIYIENNRVIKLYSNSHSIDNRIKRSKILHDFVPSVKKINENMYGYDYINGKLLSDVKDEKIFDAFYDFLEKFIIKANTFNLDAFKKDCIKIHKDKTYERVKQNKYLQELDGIKEINGISIRPIDKLLDEIDWIQIIDSAIPIYFHGDLQPENIICSENNFILIDWREAFGDSLEIGDLYYDLGKLYHAIIVNGEVIRRKQFSIDIIDNRAFINISVNNNLLVLLSKFVDFCKKKQYDWNKVLLLGALQYINISSVHFGDYSRFLFLFGKLCLEKYFQKEIKNEIL